MRLIYPFIVVYHHILQYLLLQVLETLLVVLVIGPEHCANFWHSSLGGVQDSWIFFIVVFLCLCPLLTLAVPVLVLLSMFSKWVGVCLPCVSLTISLNVSPGRLLVGFVLPLFPTWWELCTFGNVLLLLFFLFDQGSDQGTCSDFFSDQGSDKGTCLEFLLMIYLFILFSFLLK